MYKKLTCAFCFVISVFCLAVVIYLLITEAYIFSDKPPKLKLPKLKLFLVNPVTGAEQVLHETPNSEYILHFDNLNLTENQPGATYNNVYKVLRKRLRIRCHSNYPVQLRYFGFGNVTDATNYNRRQIEDISDRSTYSYTTELEFETVDEGLTGKYDCQIREENIVVASTFLYIYASGSKSFVTNFSRELIVEPGSVIEVPCPVSHPTKSITLISVLQLLDDTILVKQVEPEQIQSFDPKQGFVLYENNFGEFMCKDEANGEISGRVAVFKPISKIVKGKSLRIYSQNVDNKHRSLKLICRSTEPVELKFVNFLRFHKQPIEDKNETLEFPYAVRIKLSVQFFRGNISIVECITKKARRVIKTWKFLKYDLPTVDVDGDGAPSPQVFLQTVKDATGYQCCSNYNYTTPLLRNYPCHTPTECELRKPCLSIDPLRSRMSHTVSCPLLESANEDIYEGDPGCTKLKLTGDPSGIIRCLLDTDNRDYLYFTGLNKERIYSSVANSNKKKVDPNAMLKITQQNFRGSGPLIGRFECFGSKLYFSSGFQFGIEKLNGQIQYLINKGSRTQNSTAFHQERIDVPFTDSSNKRFYCFAPLITPQLYGPQWVNVSIAFRYDV